MTEDNKENFKTKKKQQKKQKKTKQNNTTKKKFVTSTSFETHFFEIIDHFVNLYFLIKKLLHLYPHLPQEHFV